MVSAPDDLFWLCIWLRHTAVVAALDAHRNSIFGTKADLDMLMYALSYARNTADQEAYQALQRLKDAGGLLFAFPETTKVAQGGAA